MKLPFMDWARQQEKQIWGQKLEAAYKQQERRKTCGVLVPPGVGWGFKNLTKLSSRARCTSSAAWWGKPCLFCVVFFLVRTSGFESTFATLSSQELLCAFIYSSSKLACLCVLCEMQNITPRGRGVVQDHTLEPKTAGFRASYCKQDVGHVS